jgi:hypothetical protein
MSERDEGPVNDLSWPVNDLHGLAQRLPEFDVHTYYDEQARRAYEGALLRCPVLARLLGLPGVDKPGCATCTGA